MHFDSLIFQHCKFHSDAHFYNLYPKDASSKTAENTNDNQARLDFSDSTFKEKVYFSGEVLSYSKFQISIDFREAKFENEVNFTWSEFEGEVDFSEAKFKGEAKFEDTKFKNKVDFREAEFETEVRFVKIDFKGKVDFKDAKFKKGVSFAETKFESEVDFGKICFNTETPFEKVAFSSAITLDDKFENNYLIFNEVVFDEIEIDKNFFKDKEVKFKNCTFKKNLSLSKIIFEKKISFATCTFKGDVYFNDSIFNNYAEFYASIFEKVASFYGATFKEIPNFSTCYFKEPRATNLVNIDIGALSFESLEEYIKDKLESKELETNKLKYDEKAKYARNLKDSFRIIKDVLLVKNNALDAQEWHKLELYAQEKEIEFQVQESKAKKSETKESEQNKNSAESENKNPISLWVNQHLLLLYRITSLHHTDFTRIFNFMVLMICTYGLFLLLMGILLERPNTLDNFSIIPPCIYVALTLLLYCLMVFFSVCAYPCICKIPKLFYTTLILIAIVIIVKPQLINPFVGVFSADKLYESKLEKFLNNANTDTIVNLVEILKNNPNPTESNQPTIAEINAVRTFILENKEKIKQLSKDSLSTLQSDKDLISKAFYQDEIMRNIFKSTNILYSLILLLCLFSLQKTARKNSIIAS